MNGECGAGCGLEGPLAILGGSYAPGPGVLSLFAAAPCTISPARVCTGPADAPIRLGGERGDGAPRIDPTGGAAEAEAEAAAPRGEAGEAGQGAWRERGGDDGVRALGLGGGEMCRLLIELGREGELEAELLSVAIAVPPLPVGTWPGRLERRGGDLAVAAGAWGLNGRGFSWARSRKLSRCSATVLSHSAWMRLRSSELRFSACSR